MSSISKVTKSRKFPIAKVIDRCLTSLQWNSLSSSDIDHIMKTAMISTGAAKLEVNQVLSTSKESRLEEAKLGLTTLCACDSLDSTKVFKLRVILEVKVIAGVNAETLGNCFACRWNDGSHIDGFERAHSGIDAYGLAVAAELLAGDAAYRGLCLIRHTATITSFGEEEILAVCADLKRKLVRRCDRAGSHQSTELC
jgi:hypothetical protein